MDVVTLAAAKAAGKKAFAPIGLRRRDMPGPSALPSVMTTPPTTSLDSTPPAGLVLVPWSEPGAYTYLGGRWGIVPVWNNTAFCGTGTTWSAGSSSPPGMIGTWINEPVGTISVMVRASSNAIRVAIEVAGKLQYISSGPSFTLPAGGAGRYCTINLGGAYRGRIWIEADATVGFGGLYASATATVREIPSPAVRLIGLGTSESEPTITDTNPSVGSMGHIQRLGLMMGVDAWSCGLGATGLLQAPATITITASAGTFTLTYGGQTTTAIAYNAAIATVQAAMEALSSIGTGNVIVTGSAGAYTAVLRGTKTGTPLGLSGLTVGTGSLTGTATATTKPTARGRAADWVGALRSGDILWIEELINDYGNFTAAQLAAEMALLLALVPAGVQVVYAPVWRNGVQTFPVNLLASRDAVAAVVVAAGGKHVDILTTPPASPLAPGTLQGALTAFSSNTLSSDVAYPVGSFVRIGTGTNSEVRKTNGLSGTGPYTLSFGTMGVVQNAHSAGETLTQVGNGAITGTGKQTSLQANGNSDLAIGSDSTHFTGPGHEIVAVAEYAEYALQAA